MVPFGDGSQNSPLMLAGLPNFSPSLSSFYEICFSFFFFMEAVVSLLLSRAFDMAKQVAPDKEIPGVLKKTRGKPDNGSHAFNNHIRQGIVPHVPPATL